MWTLESWYDFERFVEWKWFTFSLLIIKFELMKKIFSRKVDNNEVNLLSTRQNISS